MIFEKLPSRLYLSQSDYLKACIEQAKSIQAENHHRDSMFVQSQKLDIENRKLNLDSSKFSFEQNKFIASQIQQEEDRKNELEIAQMQALASLQISEKQAENNLKIAELQARNNLLLAETNNNNQFDLQVVNHLFENTNNFTNFLIEEIKRNNEHKRQMEMESHNARITIILEELKQKHLLETRKLEANLKRIELHLESVLKGYNLSYEKSCDIIFHIIERALELGEYQMNENDLQDWVQEAMAQV